MLSSRTGYISLRTQNIEQIVNRSLIKHMLFQKACGKRQTFFPRLSRCPRHAGAFNDFSAGITFGTLVSYDSLGQPVCFREKPDRFEVYRQLSLPRVRVSFSSSFSSNASVRS